MGVSERLFKELENQMERRGLILKKGTLMDATIVQAQVRRPSISEGARSEESVKTRTRTGLTATEGIGLTLATRCTWGWMRRLERCGGQS